MSLSKTFTPAHEVIERLAVSRDEFLDTLNLGTQ